MNIGELLEYQTQTYQDKTYLYFEEEKISYNDFNASVNRAANGFKSLDVKKGEMFAIMLPNSPAFLYSWLGLNRNGAIEVPININFKEPEIEYILWHSEASGLVIHEDYYPLLSNIKKKNLPGLRHVIVCGRSALPSGTISFSELLTQPAEFDTLPISEEEPAVCIYTSGTTDKPKGVLNSHKNWILTTLW